MKNLKTFLVFMTLSFTQVYGNCDLDVKVLDPSIKLGKYNCSNIVSNRRRSRRRSPDPGCDHVLKYGKIRCTLIRKENMNTGNCYHYNCPSNQVEGWRFKAYVDSKDYDTIQVLVRPTSSGSDFIFWLFFLMMIGVSCYLCNFEERQILQNNRYDRYRARSRYDKYTTRDSVYR